MLTPQKQALAMTAVRDQFLTALEFHEREDHAGEPCAANRLSALAYLAHSLGMGEEHLCHFAKLLEKYNRDCPDQKCSRQELTPPPRN